MTKYPSGAVTWAQDPTKTHPERPVIVLAHADRPYSSVECTVACLGTDADRYDQSTPEIEDRHLIGITFEKPTHLLPWALYTIPPGTLSRGKPTGQLSSAGEKLVGELLYKLVRGG